VGKALGQRTAELTIFPGYDKAGVISARFGAQWEAWKNQDAASNDAIIADDSNQMRPHCSRTNRRGESIAQPAVMYSEWFGEFKRRHVNASESGQDLAHPCNLPWHG
jgi:hypothetical protein